MTTINNKYRVVSTELENKIADLARILPTLSESMSQTLENILDRAYSSLLNKRPKLARKHLNSLHQSGGARVPANIQEIEYTHRRIVELQTSAERSNSDLLEQIKTFHNNFDVARDLGLFSNREMLTGAQQEYSNLNNLLRQPKYKRCRNKTAPITLESVEEVAPDDLIVFSNGACWDIDALIDYLKAPAPGGTNGQNTAENIKRHLKDYPSEKIWENDADYKYLIKHPKAVTAGLDRFIKDRQYADLAKEISDATVRVLYQTGSLLWSRGKPFEDKIKEHLNSTQLAEWRRVKSGLTLHELPPEIKNPSTEIQREVANIINHVIKSQALIDLLTYLRSVPTKERQALETIRPDFMDTLQKCHRGEYCVLAAGDMIASVYNKIVPFKSGFELLEK